MDKILIDPTNVATAASFLLSLSESGIEEESQYDWKSNIVTLQEF